MNFTSTLRIAAAGLVLAASSGAAYASTATPQNHHCKLQDGSMDMKKTKKQCLTAKGAWAKDADASATPAAAAPAASTAAPKN